MAGRRSVWSDARVRALAERFVPCADEVWRLQRGDDAECRAFQALAEQGHYAGRPGTRQGIYAATPGGHLLGSLNSLRAWEVAAMLEAALAAWERLPPAERGGDREPVQAAHRWEASAPSDGLVLRCVKRDLPASLDPAAARAPAWNLDVAWFSAEEAAALAPDDLRVGALRALPAALVERLARFHLVDNVVGQTLPFAPEEVAGSSLRSEVVGIDGARVHLRLAGEARADADGVWRLGQNDWTPTAPWPRGLRLHLLGRATWNRERRAFESFVLVGQGVRWGGSEFNGRGGDPGPAPLGVVVELADEVSPGVAPAFIDIYDAAWVGAPRHP